MERLLQIDAIQTIIDDASFSNAFALHSSRSDLAVAHGAPASSFSSSLGGTHKHRRTVPAYLHERGFEIVTEEHYLVAGMPQSALSDSGGLGLLHTLLYSLL